MSYATIRSFAFVGSLFVSLVATSNSSFSGETLLFRDDFNGTILNLNNWYTGRGTLGRTQFGTMPSVSGGVAHLFFDTYKFRGTSIFSQKTFQRTAGLTFEARIKLNTGVPSGLVAAFFSYAKDTKNSFADETDFEILTKQVNDNMTYSSGDPVLLTNMNDWDSNNPKYNDPVRFWSYLLQISGLDATQWHVYRVVWQADETIWSVDGYEYRTKNANPDAPTPIWSNFWAPSSVWLAAYDATLQPAARTSGNKRFEYQVDHAKVSIVTP